MLDELEWPSLEDRREIENISEKGDGPYRGFGYLSLFSDHIDLASITVILYRSTG